MIYWESFFISGGKLFLEVKKIRKKRCIYIIIGGWAGGGWEGGNKNKKMLDIRGYKVDNPNNKISVDIYL